ncbi:restriction endonuclease [Streptomyces sp. NPDC050564]|uniref:restriction endonuclease n=1 Tax=Streptomyces sp. NPDC050564 TaxID=3365631 RepID=UPI0037A804FA
MSGNLVPLRPSCGCLGRRVRFSGPDPRPAAGPAPRSAGLRSDTPHATRGLELCHGLLRFPAQRRRWLAVPASAACARRRVRVRGLRYVLAQFDALHHREFENAVRKLLRRNGCRGPVAGRSRADMKATDPFGRRGVIPWKHRRSGDRGSVVGTPDLQALGGTARPAYTVGVVVMATNGRVTKPGRDFAKRQRPHLVDRRPLGVRAAGSQLLWELLRAVASRADRGPGWPALISCPAGCQCGRRSPAMRSSTSRRAS